MSPPCAFCSDEIYALSVFKQQASFTSAILLAQQLVAAAAPGAAAAANAAAEPTNGATTTSSSSGSGIYSQETVDTYVHMVYGLSKDWCGSGLRVGLLYSRNQRLQQVSWARDGWPLPWLSLQRVLQQGLVEVHACSCPAWYATFAWSPNARKGGVAPPPPVLPPVPWPLSS